MTTPQDVLDFWFGPKGSEEHGTHREIWYKSTPEFDAETENRFGNAYEAAAAGNLEDWKNSREGCLALVIILDQFPRNLFRGTGKAFATDTQALAVSEHAQVQGFDVGIGEVEGQFLYMPYQHAEDRGAQVKSIGLFEKLGNPNNLQYAHEHKEVIDHFGRFPTRNKALGRESTPEELEYLEGATGWGQ